MGRTPSQPRLAHSWAVELDCNFAQQPGHIAGERAPHFDVKRILLGSPQHDVGFRKYGTSAHPYGELTRIQVKGTDAAQNGRRVGTAHLECKLPMTDIDQGMGYVREGEFTTAVFRGAQPLFIRTRNLNSNRSLEQEIKLSASYLRDTVRTESVEQCYISGTANGEISSIISEQFGAPVRKITLADMTDESWPDNAGDYESELAAATGVFTS